MKAIRLEKPEQFATVEIQDPKPPGPGEARVEVERIGVCGTDFAGYYGRMPFIQCPRILGHEVAVKVLDVGRDVANVKPGDRCALEPYLNCRECTACRRGTPNCCERLTVLGVHMDGALRPRLVLPARKLHPSKNLHPDALALVEPLGIGFHAVNRGAPREGEEALVIGAGPIGLATLEFLRIAGSRVTVIDVKPDRLELCRRKGAERTVTVGSGDPDLGILFPLVIDATGNPASMGGALRYAGHGGTVVYVGITKENVSIEDPLLHRRELSVLGSRNALPDEFDRIIALIEAGRIDTAPWVTHRTTFDGFIGDFPAFTRPESGVVKAVVEM